MGAWGYKQMQSDNGLDTIGSAVSYMIKENHGVLDIDNAYKDEISTLSHPQNYGSNIPDWRITDACISYAELIYYFSTNKQDEELWYKVYSIGAALNDMKAAVSSRKALQYIANKVKDYRKGELKTFESSGWFEREVYAKRCQWVDILIKNMDSLIAKANADRVVIWDRSKAPISLVGYTRVRGVHDKDKIGKIGDKSVPTFIINEEEAETVRRIFELYKEGYGLTQIRIKLTQEGRKNSSGQVKWHDSTLSKMLANPMYIGKQLQHKTEVVDYLTGKIKTIPKEEHELINGDSHHPNISPVISGYKQPSKSAQSIEITGFIEKSKPPEIIFFYTLLPLTA